MEAEGFGFEEEAREVEEVFLWGSEEEGLRGVWDALVGRLEGFVVEEEEEGGSDRVKGKTSFFCLLAGRISSRSTGTPNETRKRRRMRERTQFGGCRGGGAMSWVQRE